MGSRENLVVPACVLPASWTDWVMGNSFGIKEGVVIYTTIYSEGFSASVHLYYCKFPVFVENHTRTHTTSSSAVG